MIWLWLSQRMQYIPRSVSIKLIKIYYINIWLFCGFDWLFELICFLQVQKQYLILVYFLSSVMWACNPSGGIKMAVFCHISAFLVKYLVLLSHCFCISTYSGLNYLWPIIIELNQTWERSCLVHWMCCNKEIQYEILWK